MITLEQLKTKLNLLHLKYKKSEENDRFIILHQAKLIKRAIELLEEPFEVAKRIFKWHYFLYSAGDEF